MGALAKLRLALAALALAYAASPLLFKYSAPLQRALLFMHHVNTRPSADLARPHRLGLRCAWPLRLGPPGGQLGAWFIAAHRHQPPPDQEAPEPALDAACAPGPQQALRLQPGRPVVLYVHGNGGSRAAHHRAALYRKLAAELGLHVLTFDYRGYADSDGATPSAGSLVADARLAYDWLLSQPGVGPERLLVWGHSLGTGVAVRMLAELQPPALRPRWLVLEAPFDSLAGAVAAHPFAAPFRPLPFFEHFFVEPVRRAPELDLDSWARVHLLAPSRLLILHAEDDAVLPLRLGRRLYQRALEALGPRDVTFVQLHAAAKLGHKLICSHPPAMEAVRRFVGPISAQ